MSLLLAFALAANPYAKYAPAKLIIMPPDQPPVFIDYASMERCQRARAELLRQEREAVDQAAAESHGLPIGRKQISVYCIPR